MERPVARSIEALVEYWQSKCAGRPMPRRADIDPVEIPAHLADVMLIDVLDGGADFRYRLVGTRIVQAMARDATSRRISELHGGQPGIFAKVRSLYLRPVLLKRPIFVRGHIFWLPTRDGRQFEAGYLPLSDDGDNVNILLAESVFTWPAANA
jgi:hypothetical protein